MRSFLESQPIRLALAGLVATLMSTGCLRGDNAGETKEEEEEEVSTCVDGWTDPNVCLSDDTCEDPATVSATLRELTSVQLGVDDNPEIIRMMPNSSDEALFVSAVAKKVGFISYDENGFTVDESVPITGTTASSELSSIAVHPDGTFAVITRIELDCALGALMFIDLADGSVIGEVEVGYNPDSVAISKDGNWAVVANEDDREDRACKPADRSGGSVSIIDLSGGAASAAVVQTILVDHGLDSEPEGVKISPDNDTVVITIQETSEIGIFSLSDVPDATLNVVPMLAESEPDGLDISDDGDLAVISLEKGDSFSIVSLPGGDVLSTFNLVDGGHVPDTFNRNDGKSTKIHEPEEVVILRQGGALFAFLSLQESHAVIAYNITDPAAPAFDSIAIAGIGWKLEENGRSKSDIGPEGLAGNPLTGVVFSANERESSITMYKTAFSSQCTE